MNKLFLILLAIAIFIGCDQEMKQIGNIVKMDDIPIDDMPQPDEPLPEETPLEIPVDFTDIDLPPEPTIPEDANILETDHVWHVTTQTFEQIKSDYDLNNITHLEIESAVDAVKDERVIDFFTEVKQWAQDNCDNPPPFLPDFDMHIYFTSREEQQTFIDALPGDYSTWDNRKDKAWWYIATQVGVVDSTHVHYVLDVSNNISPCDMH